MLSSLSRPAIEGFFSKPPGDRGLLFQAARRLRGLPRLFVERGIPFRVELVPVVLRADELDQVIFA